MGRRWPAKHEAGVPSLGSAESTAASVSEEASQDGVASAQADGPVVELADADAAAAAAAGPGQGRSKAARARRRLAELRSRGQEPGAACAGDASWPSSPVPGGSLSGGLLQPVRVIHVPVEAPPLVLPGSGLGRMAWLLSSLFLVFAGARWGSEVGALRSVEQLEAKVQHLEAQQEVAHCLSFEEPGSEAQCSEAAAGGSPWPPLPPPLDATPAPMAPPPRPPAPQSLPWTAEGRGRGAEEAAADVTASASDGSELRGAPLRTLWPWLRPRSTRTRQDVSDTSGGGDGVLAGDEAATAAGLAQRPDPVAADLSRFEAASVAVPHNLSSVEIRALTEEHRLVSTEIAEPLSSDVRGLPKLNSLSEDSFLAAAPEHDAPQALVDVSSSSAVFGSLSALAECKLQGAEGQAQRRSPKEEWRLHWLYPDTSSLRKWRLHWLYPLEDEQSPEGPSGARSGALCPEHTPSRGNWRLRWAEAAQGGRRQLAHEPPHREAAWMVQHLSWAVGASGASLSSGSPHALSLQDGPSLWSRTSAHWRLPWGSSVDGEL